MQDFAVEGLRQMLVVSIFEMKRKRFFIDFVVLLGEIKEILALISNTGEPKDNSHKPSLVILNP